MTKKKTLLITAAILGFIIILGAGANTKEAKNSFNKGMQEAKQVVNTVDTSNNLKKEETTFTLEAKAEVDGSGKISVDGVSNLPNGALLDVSVYRLFTFAGETDERISYESRGVEKASVWDGKFNTKITTNDEAFKNGLSLSGEGVVVNKNVRVEVTFDPTRQNPSQKEEILKAVGSSGEKLINSPQRATIGEKTENPFNQLEVKLSVLYPLK